MAQHLSRSLPRIASRIASIWLVAGGFGLSSDDASATMVSFELKGTISAQNGNPFGLQVGDTITMTGKYDTTQKFGVGGGPGGDGVNTNCSVDDTGCGILFGSNAPAGAQGSDWALSLGNTMLDATQDDDADFPDLVFTNGSLESMEFAFVAGQNGSPANFFIGDGFSCSFPCSFEGSDLQENTFEGAFSLSGFREIPVSGPGPSPIPEPGAAAVFGMALLPVAAASRRRAHARQRAGARNAAAPQAGDPSRASLLA